VPCRIGTAQLMQLMKQTKENGTDRKVLLDQLLSEAEYMAKTSLCPLGQSPIMPIKSLKQYFENQF
jgi:NADH-quinone oxidoreductase subunit F